MSLTEQMFISYSERRIKYNVGTAMLRDKGKHKEAKHFPLLTTYKLKQAQ